MHLVPCPRHLERRPGAFGLGRRLELRFHEADPRVVPALARLRRVLDRHDCDVGPATAGSASIELVLEPSWEEGDEAYHLSIGEHDARLRAGTAVGLFHAVGTLAQLLRGDGGPLPCVEIRDAPALRDRGLMLDVSRNKVPSLATLEVLVELAADLKLNQLQLYFEHAFAYRGHETVWRGVGAYTAEDMRRLDALCAERFIRLVPNQNSLGHMHQWLRHDEYRALAEVPEGLAHPFGSSVEPFSLCPTDPRTLELLDGLYRQLLPAFGTSAALNVGLDETFDLGKGRSAAACEAKGRHRVYLEFLLKVHQLVAQHGRQMQFWGDIIIEEPALIPELPADAVALLWGYEANHPFDEHAARFAEAGLAFYLCPGTSSWNSMAGRLPNARDNIRRAARAARDHGADGLLITDWGDNGHLQPLSASVPGIVLGAGYAWNPDDPGLEDDLPTSLDRHVFGQGSGLGGAACGLGEAYLRGGAQISNGTVAFRLLTLGDRRLPDAWSARLIPADFEGERAYVDAIRSGLRDGSVFEQELGWAADMLIIACELGMGLQRAGVDEPLAAISPDVRRRCATALRSAMERLSPLWTARNRPEGLSNSRGHLERTLHALDDRRP